MVSSIPLEKHTFLVTNFTLRGIDFFVDTIVGFPASPETTFKVFSLLDSLCLRLIQSGNLSTTDTIRLKSLMENCRMVVISKLSDVQGYEMDCASIFEKSLNSIDF